MDDLKSRISGITATYIYSNPTTRQPEMFVLRIDGPDGKRFMQGKPHAGGIVLQAPPKPWPIYNRARLAGVKDVLVVEGEKCVHRLHDAGFVATTSPGGAGKAQYADWSPLAGKTVYLWPDNDPPNAKGERTGISHMRAVAAILERLQPAPRVHWINPDSLGLPPKGDAVEFCDKFQDEESLTVALAELMGRAEPLGASADVRSVFNDIFAGRRRTIPWPWQETSLLTRAIQPGTLTLLCGDGGAAKSLMLLEAVTYWHRQVDGKISIYELEEDRAYHLRRALAQQSGESRITDDDWVKQNQPVVSELEYQHREYLDQLGRVMHEAPLEPLTLLQMSEWVRERCEAGDKIICIDPITAATVGDKSWLDDQKFIISVKAELVRHEAACVLATHPKKGHGKSWGMDDLAGGACWARFSQTILWLKLDPPNTEYEIDGPCGRQDATGNRTLSILKARNAPGGGGKIAFNLDTQTLRLTELGRIAQKRGPAQW
jgi:hypothetical protein